MGNGLMTVNDQLTISDNEIIETIKSEWVVDKESVFQMSLRIRFAELQVSNDQLNAKCLAADVLDVKDPKGFAKLTNLKEQAANTAKTGVGRMFTWTLNGAQLQRGEAVWLRQK